MKEVNTLKGYFFSHGGNFGSLSADSVIVHDLNCIFVNICNPAFQSKTLLCRVMRTRSNKGFGEKECCGQGYNTKSNYRIQGHTFICYFNLHVMMKLTVKDLHFQ